MSSQKAPELVCPAGSPRAPKLGIDAGGDAVYLGLRNATNARNFAGLNFSEEQLREGMAYASERHPELRLHLSAPPANRAEMLARLRPLVMRLPSHPPAAALPVALNRWLLPQIPDDARGPLSGRCVGG